MEEDQYLMWMKRRQVLKSHIQAPFEGFNSNSSWEERAFAEDAVRILGGCIWPPRSYSCNFCKREFRSAQALGGHMNVHRRDRARLKQSLSSHNNDESLSHHHHKNDCKSLGDAHQFSADQNSSQLDSCLNPVPYSSSLADGTVTTSKISSSVSSNISTQEDLFQHNMSYYSISWGKKMRGSPDSEPKGPVNIAREKSSKGLSYNNYGCVETGLSVGLNSVFSQKFPTDSCDHEDMTYKRPKTSSMSPLPVPVFLKPCSNDNRLPFQSAESVLGLKPGMEDLDLELRLGKPQKA